MKRTLSLLLVLMMLISMLPLNAFAAETAQADQMTEAVKIAESTELAEVTEEAVVSEPEAEHTHEYAAGLSAPTCTGQGYTTYTCDCGDSYVADYVDATGHSYANGSCTECGSASTPYLQQLPENITGCSNLYDLLTPSKGYYTATKYDTSNGAVLSVVIPVEPGDRIAASSFGPVSENMGSVNGIRVTYLLGDKIVSSLSAGDVYNGYTTNGYITVPDGVDAVCIPWWIPSDSNWLTLGQISKNFTAHSPKAVPAQAPTCMENGYTAGEICEVCGASLGTREEIPATGHDYNGNTCTICGTVNVLAILDGKYVSVLGDSISTFNGYSNDAAVNTTIGGNGPRYDAGAADTKPGSYCLLESVDDTWWMHFANRSGMKLLVNNSWAGSQVFGGQTSDGRQIPPAYLARCINLHDNTTDNNPGNAPINPDVIFVYLGINDYNFNRNNVGSGAVDYAKLRNSDGSYVTPTTFSEAYGIMLHKMRNAYPDAQIFAMTLLPENLYSVDMAAWEQHNAYIRAAAEYYDIPLVDLAEKCAITWENYSGYMMDKIHPTTAGMKLISDCIEAELVAYYKENLSHTHTYETAVTAPTCTEQGYTTYTCDCGESFVADYVDATGHFYENGVCSGCGVAAWDTDGDGALEILAIGNSFSVDALEYAYQIAQNLGIQEIVLGNLYIGGCTLATHVTNAVGDLGKYTYYYNDNGTWTSTGSYKISTALESRTWDYVSMQQGSPVSGVESSYNDDLTDLIAYVQARSDAKLVWHMTWAYQQNSTHSAFPTYNKDQMTMYNAIVSAVQNKIVTNSAFDLIVPNGTAVQNSRTSLLGDTTTRDGYHMSYTYGRYLTGLLFIKTVTGLSVDGVTYVPSGVDAEKRAIAIESVNNAAAKPFAVTKSKYVNEVPEEGYILLQTPIYQGAYWHPQKNGSYNELIDGESNSPNFFTTIRFTRETLPVGSIITLESGWQYRPDGWVTDALQTGTRENATTKAFQIVTEEWWGNYTIRSFNVSRTSGGSVMDLTEEEMRSIFRIYVPEEKHFHDYTSAVTAPTCTEQGYTTYTCTLCGDSFVDDYADATGHSYQNGTCTICGAEHPNLANYEGKVISILGDSISTFAGYIPVADGFNLEHKTRYPQDNLLTDVNETWWMQIIKNLDAKLGINDSWASSEVYNYIDAEVNSTSDGTKACMASVTRIQNLGSNGTPDVILFFGGTNDITQSRPLGTFDPSTAPSEVDLISVKWDTVADAYVDAIMRMQHYYPDAQIVAMLPFDRSSQGTTKVNQYNSLFISICEHYGVPYVDLRECGISNSDLPDGTHPDATGMDYITAAVMDVLMSDCDVVFGEHIVHSVTHNLTDAKSSLSYYKGISHGKAFVTTITGEDVTVTVTMGGTDITTDCYANGVVSVENVTGNLVITAEGLPKTVYADYLQELPTDLCSGTNLWATLEPINLYYRTSGWGLNATGSAHSITFPVSAGDQIWATSFQASGLNGGTKDGIALTWFDKDGAIETFSPEKTYAEFAKNGYLTAPEGAVAVNVVMWNGDESNEAYILNRDHTYQNATCTACGAAQPGPIITQQPVDGEAKLGERYMVEVKAEGEGLKYQWYLRNAGSKSFSRSSVKDSTYDDVMTTARAGREVYCVITDANGNSVTTDAAKLICLPSEELAITKQPTDGEAVLGERYCVTVEAKGEKLKYQWYFRNKGATNWSKSGVTDNTYDDVMNTTRDGREVYCVITDIAGNKVTTDIVKLVRVPMKLEITSQPTDAKAAFDEMFCATVEARGEGLKYQWYYRNAGANTWHKSGVRDNTYDDIMTKARNGREVYCVITDKYGNSVTTDIAKLIAVPKVELKILSQTYESAAMGGRYCVTVKAQGDGLTYQWYFRNAGATRWSKSGVRDNTYDDVMNKTRANREVYCVITDATGNQVTTDVVTLTVKN